MNNHKALEQGAGTAPAQQPTADALNQHLREGGVVQVSTYLRSTLYRQKHAGMFYEAANGDLRVKSGNSSVCLATTSTLLVHIRLGRVA